MLNNESKKKKSRFIIIILITAFLFSISLNWLHFYQSKVNAEEQMFTLSTAIAENIKTMYESRNESVLLIEPLITENMKSILIAIESDIQNNKAINSDFLNKLQNKYNISGIYIIEKDGIIRLTSNGETIQDTSNFYSDRPDVNWEETFDRLINNKGEVFIDTFSKSETPPYSLNKWGYRGIGHIDGLGLVVLEVGVKIDDLKYNNTNILNKLHNMKNTQKSVISIEINHSSPSKKSDFKENQWIKDNIIYTSINVQNIAGSDPSQIIVGTNFSNIQSEVQQNFYNTIITSLFFVFIASILITLHVFEIKILKN